MQDRWDFLRDECHSPARFYLGTPRHVNSTKYQWAAKGDINAFFGLMLDNIAGLVLTVTMLATIFDFPVDFALKYMIPGTAIGVLAGDLMYFGLAFVLARKQNRSDVTAMPLGLDTPSTIGMVLFVLGPSFLEGKADGLAVEEAAMRTWHIGICAIFISGIVKALFAFSSNWIRNAFPRAGLLGSLAAIALVLIAFSQLPKIAENPIVGFSSLVIVLATLVARGELPFKIPGALGAVLVGCFAWYVLRGIDFATGTELAHVNGESQVFWFPTEWLTVFNFEWTSAFNDSLVYLPYIIPFAIATVIGGIDCTESAASVGDNYNTNQIIGIESLATMIAALCGGVIQTTPYIGHPAYKIMGGRAAYTLATALFVGGAGVIGYFGLLFKLIPEAAVLPILVFIGIEITAQSFLATPKRHYTALAIACLPALAKLVVIYLGQFLTPEQMNGHGTILHLRMMAGGFIITSLIWAAAMAKITDRRFIQAAGFFGLGAVLVLFGVIHSPIDGDKMFLPWNIGVTLDTDGAPIVDAVLRMHVVQLCIAYLVMAGLMFGLGYMMKPEPIDSDEQFRETVGHL
ncbi:MAG: permease [bacterium]|nr:permease [bacterium]